MLGRLDEAKKNVDAAKQAADRNPGNAGIRDGYLGMRARLHLGDRAMGEAAARAAGAPAVVNTPACPGCPACDGGGSATWTYIVGVSAAKMGDLATAEAAEAAAEESHRDGTAGGADVVCRKGRT